MEMGSKKVQLRIIAMQGTLTHVFQKLWESSIRADISGLIRWNVKGDILSVIMWYLYTEYLSAAQCTASEMLHSWTNVLHCQ